MTSSFTCWFASTTRPWPTVRADRRWTKALVAETPGSRGVRAIVPVRHAVGTSAPRPRQPAGRHGDVVQRPRRLTSSGRGAAAHRAVRAARRDRSRRLRRRVSRHDATLGRDVAIKIPRPEALVSDELRQRFLREARAAGNLDHPNVVPIYDVGEDGAVCYIAAAYIEGPSLAVWLGQRQEHDRRAGGRRARRRVGRRRRACARPRRDPPRHQAGQHPACSPTSRAQSRRACRSIRPSSRTSGWPSCANRPTRPRARAWSSARRPTWRPSRPRGASARSTRRPTSTRWGAILYELLAGQPPLRGESDVDTLRRIVTDDPPLVRFARPGHSARHRGDLP